MNTYNYKYELFKPNGKEIGTYGGSIQANSYYEATCKVSDLVKSIHGYDANFNTDVDEEPVN